MVVLKEECGLTVGEVETFSLGLISDKDNINMNTMAVNDWLSELAQWFSIF